MPHINVNVSQQLDVTQKQDIVTEFGKMIELIPGKSESSLMVQISDYANLYFAGHAKQDAAYIDVKIYKETPLDSQKAFIEATCEYIHKYLGTPVNNIYVTFMQLPNWGYHGSLI